ncbi:MAG: sugar transferase [candidate division Zixibacteria bacterium]|nr:sugar transferase [candidate division Zixibacteria bacterium]
MKRTLDVVISVIVLIILSPLFLCISLAVLVTMGWPIFFRQTRMGKDSKAFKIVKFRTMVKKADKLGLPITTGGDPRITPVGRLLRRSKLDELPQFLNVLWGHMSLVGPRPEVPRYVRMYSRKQMRVLSVKPGLTDPATIAFRNEESILARYDDPEKAYVEEIMPEKLKLNLAYIERASFFGDIGILLKTFVKLFDHR